MALIPPGYLKAIVSLGVCEEEQFMHHGTGFLCNHPVAQKEGSTSYRSFLVTNRHVAQEDDLSIRFNRITSGALEIHPLASVAMRNWTMHPDPDVDVAVLPVSGILMEERNVVEAEIFFTDIGAPSDTEVRDIAEGNGVFVLGFPLGLVGEERNYPIVRHGIVARIQDWLRGDERTFLIDASVFPGNSGGPVVLKPETVAVHETRAITHSLLIGMVRAYIPSQEVAVSERTGRPKVIFEENSGLAEVVPIDVIRETMKLAIR